MTDENVPNNAIGDDELETLAARFRLCSEADRIRHLTTLAERSGLRASFAAAATELPDRAPELWADRDLKRGELAISFLRRVYGPWLPDKIKLADMLAIDQALWSAVISWKSGHRHFLPADLVPFFKSRPNRLRLEGDRLLESHDITDAAQIVEKLPGEANKSLRRRLKKAFLRRQRRPPIIQNP